MPILLNVKDNSITTFNPLNGHMAAFIECKQRGIIDLNSCSRYYFAKLEFSKIISRAAILIYYATLFALYRSKSVSGVFAVGLYEVNKKPIYY